MNQRLLAAKAILSVGILTLCWSCARTSQQNESASARQTQSQPAAPVVKVAHLPPSPKDLIAALVESAAVPLSIHPSCEGAGTEAEDRTLGRYFSGFLAELRDAEATNAMETSMEAGQLPTGESVWDCRVMIRHAKGEDIWRWGVGFAVRQSDGLVITNSYRCLGAG